MSAWIVKTTVSQSNYQWSKSVDITQPSYSDVSAFGILLCDQYQNVHLLWSHLADDGAAIFYRNDVEGSWGSPIDVLAFTDPVAVYLDAAISDVNNTLHLVWQNAYLGGDLYYSSASLPDADNARSWSQPRALAQNTGAGSIATDAQGTIHLVHGTSGGDGLYLAVNYLRSQDDGKTWSEPAIVFSTLATVPSDVWGEIAADDQGRLYVGITWRSQEYGVQSEVGYVLSPDGGQTWSEYERVEATGTTFQGVTKLVPYAFGNGEVHLTWHDPRRMHQWSFDGGVTWNAPVEIMPLGAAFGGPNDLVRDSAGTVHVVTAVADGVFSAAWDGKRWGPPERIDDRYIDPHGQHMVVCQGNQLHVVYYDRIGDNTVWYAFREVEAPHIARQSFPASTSLLPDAPTATVPVSQTGDSLIHNVISETAEPAIDKASSEPIRPLIVSALVVFVFITIVFVLKRLMGH
ncbi:MAG: exo-alpha-sialidase [Anaerolineae bacterium]|nr:exo-alpha-sialidase [Anaerolineae bacterium]